MVGTKADGHVRRAGEQDFFYVCVDSLRGGLLTQTKAKYSSNQTIPIHCTVIPLPSHGELSSL